MVMQGCQGKPEVSVQERTCPQCGNEIEIFSIDVEATCDNCGFVIYNDSLNCVQWCKYARQCVGDERYEQLMKIAQSQRERKEAQRNAKNNEQHAQSADQDKNQPNDQPEGSQQHTAQAKVE